MDWMETYKFVHTIDDGETHEKYVVEREVPNGMESMDDFVDFCRACARAIGYAEGTIEKYFGKY